MIRILPPEEARKIAAGEVIDRPAALVRELLDNALDSGATAIEVFIEGGGIGKIEVVDNGSGMNRDDLALCTVTHATSKIQSLDDLSRSTTLGFRGEALAAAAAVARLEIVTSAGGSEAWLLESTNPGTDIKISQTRRTQGTSVRAFGLFDAIPARKRFLKREAGEAALCRQVFIEKALAFPGVSFRFFQDHHVKLNCMPCTAESGRSVNDDSSDGGVPGFSDCLQQRFGELILNPGEGAFLHSVQAAGKGFTVTVIFGGPELYRRDRKQQYIFANSRRIQDYGLMQALEYGLAGFFPNDSHPVGAVFVEVDPALADFNIHPAKREVRFADAGSIHHCITAALRNYVNSTAGTAFTGIGAAPYRPEWAKSGNYLAMQALLERRDDFIPLPSKNGGGPAAFAAEPEPAYARTWAGAPLQNPGDAPMQSPGTMGQNIRLVGRVFDLFIIVEREDRLYLIDQHAAHERVLYNNFLSAPITAQELLVAVPFTTSSDDEDQFLRAKKEELARLGIVLENEGGGAWRIDALPAGWKTSDGETVEAILALQGSGENLGEHWAAVLACRAAIKDGGFLDDEAALTLAQTVLAQADKTGQLPRCPHGRPLWVELSREDLFRAVRRIE